MGKKIKSPKLSPKMLKKSVDLNFKSTLLWSVLMLVLSLGIFGYGGYVWFNKVANDGEQLFYSMLSRSLETSSVSRVITQDESGRNEVQNYHLTFTPTPMVHTSSSVEQITQSRETSSVATEMIGLRNTDYVRYTSVNIPKTEDDKNDYSRLLNTWAKRDAKPEEGSEAQFLNEAAFTFIPFGNFNESQRQEIMKMIKDKKVYELNLDKAKLSYENYRPVYNMNVSVNPRQLVTVMKSYAEITGIGNTATLNPDEFQDDYVFSIRLKIDPVTRHLREMAYPGSTRVEKYVGYGVNKTAQLPIETTTIEELQSRVQ